jgi:hypothetical protein
LSHRSIGWFGKNPTTKNEKRERKNQGAPKNRRDPSTRAKIFLKKLVFKIQDILYSEYKILYLYDLQ